MLQTLHAQLCPSFATSSPNDTLAILRTHPCAKTGCSLPFADSTAKSTLRHNETSYPWKFKILKYRPLLLTDMSQSSRQPTARQSTWSVRSSV